MTKEQKQICDLVYECGQIIKNADRSSILIDEKAGHANFVTEYDKMIQEKLKKGLFEIAPQVTFIGEEGEQESFSHEGSFFIVDPIDGTTNFIKDYHMSCVSVGLIVNGKAEFGVVYNPYLDEMYTAFRGMGAFCNGKAIHVSKEPLENGVVLFGSAPYNQELNKASFEMAFSYFQKSLDIRRSGSAALDLCAIAAGRAEVYFELRLSPWDYAAGALIVEEAGGIVTDIDGNPIDYDKPRPIIAKNM